MGFKARIYTLELVFEQGFDLETIEIWTLRWKKKLGLETRTWDLSLETGLQIEIRHTGIQMPPLFLYSISSS